MKLQAVYNVETYKLNYLLRKGIGGLLMLSAVLKIFAVDYMIDLLFTMMPISWIGWMSKEILLIGLITLIGVELLLGVLLWIGKQLSRILSVTILFLMLMSLLNGYQWWLGIADCGCLGWWISMPPEATIVKTLVLLGTTVYLKFAH